MAGLVLAVIILGGLVAVGLLRRGNSPAHVPAKHGPAVAAAKPEMGTIIFQSRVDGFWQIFSLDLSSGVRTRLTRSAADDITPSVSPDGSWVLFQSSRSGSADVWRMRADGTAVEQLTDATLRLFRSMLERRRFFHPLQFSPSGRAEYLCPGPGHAPGTATYRQFLAQYPSRASRLMVRRLSLPAANWVGMSTA